MLNTFSPSQKVTVIGSRIQPSFGTSSHFSGVHNFSLSKIVAQEMESVQVHSSVPSSTSSGSRGAGFPSGTGLVKYLSRPVPVSIIIPLTSSYSPVAPAPISSGVINSERSMSTFSASSAVCSLEGAGTSSVAVSVSSGVAVSSGSSGISSS